VQHSLNISLLRKEMEIEKDEVKLLAYAPDGRLAGLRNRGSGRVYIWDQEGSVIRKITPQELDNELRGRDEFISLAYSPDGNLAVGLESFFDEDRVFVWGIQGDIIRVLEAGGKPGVLAYSFDGRRLAVGLRDGRVRIWDQDGRFMQELPPMENLWDLAYGPEGRLAVGSQTGDIRIWNPQGTSFKEFGMHSSLDSLAFNEDGRLASGLIDGRVIVWTYKGRLLHTLQAGDFIESVTFSPDGKIAAGFRNGVRIWNQNGILIQELDTEDSVEALAYGPDGELAVATEEEIQVWIEGPGRYTKPARKR
jgi:WD40 repeat protein